MKPLGNLLIYTALLSILTACSLLEEPAPLAPLKEPKTQKEAYKAVVCRPKSLLYAAYTYAVDGKLQSAKGFFGTSQSYEYDADGFLVSMTTTTDDGSSQDKSTYFYNNQGKLTSVIESTNNVERYAWSYQNGQLDGGYPIINGKRGPNECTVDGQGRLTKQGDTVFEYDAAGVLRSITLNSIGWKFIYEYDDKINPETLIPLFKGHPKKYHDSAKQANNFKNVRVFIGGTLAWVETYEYVYKGLLPSSVKVGRVGETEVLNRTYAYDGCID